MNTHCGKAEALMSAAKSLKLRMRAARDVTLDMPSWMMSGECLRTKYVYEPDEGFLWVKENEPALVTLRDMQEGSCLHIIWLTVVCEPCRTRHIFLVCGPRDIFSLEEVDHGGNVGRNVIVLRATRPSDSAW